MQDGVGSKQRRGPVGTKRSGRKAVYREPGGGRYGHDASWHVGYCEISPQLAGACPEVQMRRGDMRLAVWVEVERHDLAFTLIKDRVLIADAFNLPGFGLIWMPRAA